MREIKFRAWDKEEKRWMTAIIEDVEESELRLTLDGEVTYKEPWVGSDLTGKATISGNNRFELMQYTGKTDRDGAEVYFNDVVEDEYGHRYEVVFEGDCLRCNGVRRIRGGYKPKNRWFGIDLKIIGNANENPELMINET